MNLSSIEYNAIMMAIDNAKDSIAEDAFIDPYAEIPKGYTNELLLEALVTVERKIVGDNLPY